MKIIVISKEQERKFKEMLEDLQESISYAEKSIKVKNSMAERYHETWKNYMERREYEAADRWLDEEYKYREDSIDLECDKIIFKYLTTIIEALV